MTDEPVLVPPLADPGVRLRRLHDVIGRTRIAGRRVDGERVLFALGAILAPLGLLLIAVAWHGVANTGAVFEQVPFLVSGGLGGLALVVVGSALYFGWWQTRALRETRERAARDAAATDRLLEELRGLRAAQDALAEELRSLRPAPRKRSSGS